MTPGEQLREWRLAKGWTVARLACEMRCSETTIYAWQAGRYRPGEARRERLECMTGIPADSWPVGGLTPRAKDARRALYWRRRDAGVCVDCEDPTDGTARCEPCLRHRRPRKRPRKPAPPPKPKATPRLDPDRRRIRRAPSWIETWREMRRAS